MTGGALFLSDLHLRAHDDARTAAVVQLLRRHRGRIDALFLVGDIFDFWLGYEHVIFRPFFPFLRALADLVDDGVRVAVVAGNHDPDPGTFFESFGAEVHTGPLQVQLGAHTVWMEHGDLVDPRGHLRRLTCRLARAPALLWWARRIPPALAWRLASTQAGRDRFEYDSKLPSGLIDTYFPARIAAGADVVVLGHYHRAVSYAATVEGRIRRFFVLGDWIAHNTYLHYQPGPSGGFTLYRDRGDADPIALPHGDHPPLPQPTV